MPEDVLFETESKESRESIAAYLRDIANKLEAGGDITLNAGSQTLTMAVPARPTFEVKAEREYSRGGGNEELSLELELEWKEGAETEGDTSLSVE